MDRYPSVRTNQFLAALLEEKDIFPLDLVAKF